MRVVYLIAIDEMAAAPASVSTPAPVALPPPERRRRPVVALISAFSARPPWRAPIGAPPDAPVRPSPAVGISVEVVMFGDGPFASAAFGASANTVDGGLEVKLLRFGTENVIDGEGNEWVFGLSEPGFERSLLGGSGLGGLASSSLGDIEIVNAGDWDHLPATTAVDGRPVELRQLAPDGTTKILAEFTARDWSATTEVIRCRLKDWDYLLDKPVQGAVYPDDHPMTDLRNRTLPLAYGYCRNLQPVRIATTPPTYQVSQGPIRSIGAIYAGGVPLTAGDIAARDPVAGTFTLVTEPSGTVTCDIEGRVAGNVDLKTTATVIRDLAERAGLPAARIDTDAFTRMDQDLPGEIQVYFGMGDSANTLDVINGLLSPYGWGGFNWRGQLRVGVLRVPFGDPVCALTEDDGTIVSIERVDLPSGVYPPPWRVRGGYDRNFTVQGETDLKGDPSSAADPVGGADRRRWLGREQDTAVAQDTAVRDVVHLGAQDPAVIATAFRYRVDVETVLQAYLSLWLGNRQLWRIVADVPAYWLDLDAVVTARHRRLGAATVLGRVVGIREGGQTELTVLT